MTEYLERESILNAIRKSSNLYVDQQGLYLSCELIAEMPAADVQLVKHGRWSECYTDTHHYSGICSVCGKASIKSLAESLYAFCPKCGARMDGDTK